MAELDPVHGCDYSSQPYVTLRCTGAAHYVGWGYTEPVPLPDGVYRCDGGLYTFDNENESCPECLGIKNSLDIGWLHCLLRRLSDPA